MWVRVPPPAPEKGKSEQDFPFSGAAPSARFDPLRSNAKGDSHPLSRSPHADLKAGSDLDCLGAPRPCGKGNRPACVPAAASLYRGYLSCVPSILLSIAVLPEKVSCLVVASCVSLVSPQAAKLTRSAAPPLPTKPCGFAGAPTIAAYSGVGTLPAASGRFVPK